jgi:hypothetical protein
MELRFPHFLDNELTHGGEVISLTRSPPLTPGRFLVLISLSGWVDPRAILWLKVLGQLKNATSSGIEPMTFLLRRHIHTEDDRTRADSWTIILNTWWWSYRLKCIVKTFKKLEVIWCANVSKWIIFNKFYRKMCCMRDSGSSNIWYQVKCSTMLQYNIINLLSSARISRPTNIFLSIFLFHFCETTYCFSTYSAYINFFI